MTPTSARRQEKLSFRTFVLLLLHHQNPSWSVSNIADFFEHSENPSNLNRHESLSNPHNAGGWARNAAEIPLSIRNRPRNKFAIGVVFWGGISYDGLIPKNGLIDVTSWLKAQVKENRPQKTYMNRRLYAKFIKEVGYKHIRKLSSTELLFQDDPDTKHRTKHVLETIDKLFIDRILPQEGDAKFADVRPIEKVWGILKEKVPGEQFSSFEQLEVRVNKNGRKLPMTTVKK
ncbi:unnamed protein product [Rotaria sp. Silwood1]|nr:unnamed protein product [Rotaria sp. Silwood1]CAF1638096.1 unnamed protein product [Rotaria sp. Silwood1]